MKVAVSIPDDVFLQGEAVAQRLKLSRSKLYALAVKEYARNHGDGGLTEAINAALDAAGEDDNLEFVRRASRQVFARTEWK